MSRFDAVRERNASFAAGHRHDGAPIMPRLGLAVLTCLDPRVDPAEILGLELGDAAVLRNAGGRVTDAVIEDLAFIGQLAEAARPTGPLFEVAVLHHTECGTAALADEHLRRIYGERIGVPSDELVERAVHDPEATVRADLARLRGSAAIPDRVSCSGHVYDVQTGRVHTVVDAAVVV